MDLLVIWVILRDILHCKVTEKDQTSYPEINVNEINQLIPLHDGWSLNQSVCKYIPPDNYVGPLFIKILNPTFLAFVVAITS